MRMTRRSRETALAIHSHRATYEPPLGRAFRSALQKCQHLFGVAFRLHFVKDLFDLSIRANDERRASHPHDFLAIHILFLDHAVSIANLLVGVAQEGKWKIELILKLLERFWFIRRNSQNHSSALLRLFV